MIVWSKYILKIEMIVWSKYMLKISNFSWKETLIQYNLSSITVLLVLYNKQAHCSVTASIFSTCQLASASFILYFLCVRGTRVSVINALHWLTYTTLGIHALLNSFAWDIFSELLLMLYSPLVLHTFSYILPRKLCLGIAFRPHINFLLEYFWVILERWSSPWLKHSQP